MRTYLSSIIPQLKQHSEKLDNLALLTNQHWVLLNEELDQVKCVYIFRTTNELLISRNGKVEKARWEYVGHQTLLVDLEEGSFLFKHGFFDANVLALKVDNREEYAFLINESRFDQELNSVARVQDFLGKMYLDKTMDPKLQQWVGEPKLGEGIAALADGAQKVYPLPGYEKRTLEKKWKWWALGEVSTYEVRFQDGLTGVYGMIAGPANFFEVDGERRYYLDEHSCICKLHQHLVENQLKK